MRKVLFPCGILILLAGVPAFSGCDVSEMGTLSDVSKPYVGFYECEALTLGGEDLTDKFEKVSLELSYNGKYTLTYTGADGTEGKYSGTYRVDTENNEITVTSQAGLRAVEYTFPLTKGTVYIDLNLHGKLLHAEFGMP